MSIFKLPDLGEGLPDAEIVEWHVQVGDAVVLDQLVVSMETAKAIVEVPSPIEGRILRLYGKSGDVIQTGAPLMEFESEKREDSGTVAGRLEVTDTIITEPAIGLSRPERKQTVKATPMVRALAQRLHVNLDFVTPTGPNGVLTTQDVEHAALSLQSVGSFELLKGVRRVMAENMSRIHSEVVPVTVMEDVLCHQWPQDADITVRLIRALILACQQEPSLNAWFDGKSLSRRLMSEVHLGLAMDMPEGLFVPVISNAEKLNDSELRQHIEALKQEVRDRTLAPERLRGATLILSNFGRFGGRYATPILVPPMVAILGVGSKRIEPKVINGKIDICPVLPLSLTFDHRAVTGGEATRFLSAVIKALGIDCQ